MININVIGHKSPDTDCVASAIIMSDYLNKKEYNAKAFKAGNLNNETDYLLGLLNIEVPETANSFPEGTIVALVDHNEKSQTLDNISDLKIEYIVDHHKFELSTMDPLNVRAEKLCSTASVLFKMYKEAGFEISKEIGTLMLAAVLSDSLLFRSATTTKEDTLIAEELKVITGITDLDKFMKPLFDAKSDLGDMSIEEIIKYDYKNFEVNGKVFGLGTLETTNPGYALGRKEEILAGLASIKQKDNLEFIMLSVVDIIGEVNTSIVLDGDDTKVVEEIFSCKVENNLADLKNRLSRKKQVAPDVTKYFS